MTLSLPAPVRAVFDATNAGDTDAFLDAFTPDGVVDDWVASSTAAKRSSAGVTARTSACMRS